MKIQPYSRKTQYYETDQMGIIHHSNYIRYFEEARIDFMAKCGLEYEKMEHDDIISPVMGVKCSYKESLKFGDTAVIIPFIKEYDGIKLVIGYNIYNERTKVLCTTGESKHCFIKDGQIISLKKTAPAFHSSFLAMEKAEAEFYI